MKKIGLMILFFLALAPIVKGQNCDCTIAPFEPSPPCHNKCTSALRALATSNMEELQLILGLEESTTQSIVNWNGRRRAKTLKDYKAILSEKEIEYIGRKINSLTETQLEYFEKPVSKRRLIRRGRRRY
jgi:hypothetical protein